MAYGKYLSLEEARKLGKLKEFAKQHPSTADRGRFERLLDAMTRSSPTADQTSTPASSEGYSETQTPPGTLKDADG